MILSHITFFSIHLFSRFFPISIFPSSSNHRYASADKGIEELPTEARNVIRVARVLYHQLHDAIRDANYDVFRGTRVRVSFDEKIRIVTRLVSKCNIARVLAMEIVSRFFFNIWLPSACPSLLCVFTMGIVQYFVPSTYLDFHLLWTAPSIMLLGILNERMKGNGAQRIKWCVLMCFVATLYVETKLRGGGSNLFFFPFAHILLLFLLLLSSLFLSLCSLFSSTSMKRKCYYLILFFILTLDLIVLIFRYTTFWDNYLVYRGVWTYPENRVLTKIGFVPLEEYMFFSFETILVCFACMVSCPHHVSSLRVSASVRITFTKMIYREHQKQENSESRIHHPEQKCCSREKQILRHPI